LISDNDEEKRPRMRGLFIFKLYLKINQEARLWGLLKKSLELNKKIMYFLYIIFL